MNRTGILTLLLAFFGFAAFSVAAVDKVPETSASEMTPVPMQEGDNENGIVDEIQFDGAWVSLWTSQAAQAIELMEQTTMPLVLNPLAPFDPGVWIWDWWPLRNPDGSVAVIDGWVVMIGLTAENEGIIPGERHGLATWRYYFTNGQEWQDGGPVFPEGTAIGTRQWAGSTVYNPETGRATFFYTALGELLPADVDVPVTSPVGAVDEYEESNLTGLERFRQLIATASARVVAGPEGIRFEDFSEHEALLSPDGVYYVTAEQSAEQRIPYVFRDPFYFLDPNTGEEFLLFTAMPAFKAGPHSGAAGLARLNDLGRWELLPPVLIAPEVNFQIERPNVLVQDDRYYLFFTSHAFSFAEGLDGPEGLYGFVSDTPSVRGHYTPLNGSGLVLGNPDYAPLQTYSYLVLPGGYVTSYINYFDLGDVTLAEISQQTREWQREHFGGSPAPLLQIAIEGDETRLLDTLTPIGPVVGGTDETRAGDDGSDGDGNGGDDGNGDQPPGPPPPGPSSLN